MHENLDRFYCNKASLSTQNKIQKKTEYTFMYTNMKFCFKTKDKHVHFVPCN